MVFSKAIAFDEEKIREVALATGNNSAEIEFIEKLKQGDAVAFDTFVQRYTSDIYGLLYRITEDAEEAADLTQETFIKAFKAIKKFRGDAELKTWLFRIAINQSKNRFRWWKRRKREKTVSLDAPVGQSKTPMSEIISTGLANPEENTLQNERQKFLSEALQKLPDIFREAVVLCDIEGLSYEEISTVLEINLGTVKSRIARGREELRKKLKDF
ncbi:MAG: sigma-70 family RNA polymerase sigma factor [Aridibacter sp.]|jgi:RNA polymerase sigma-70 factor (ECF subfamily)|nr:sigma-70 family RNA polymerase sigma factor [Acidobacteriota bacterium]